MSCLTELSPSGVSKPPGTAAEQPCLAVHSAPAANTRLLEAVFGGKHSVTIMSGFTVLQVTELERHNNGRQG